MVVEINMLLERKLITSLHLLIFLRVFFIAYTLLKNKCMHLQD